jgi:hypothetical protein
MGRRRLGARSRTIFFKRHCLARFVHRSLVSSRPCAATPSGALFLLVISPPIPAIIRLAILLCAGSSPGEGSMLRRSIPQCAAQPSTATNGNETITGNGPFLSLLRQRPLGRPPVVACLPSKMENSMPVRPRRRHDSGSLTECYWPARSPCSAGSAARRKPKPHCSSRLQWRQALRLLVAQPEPARSFSFPARKTGRKSSDA